MTRNALITLTSGLLLAGMLCAGLDALAQPAPDPQPGPLAPHEEQVAWSLRHRVYRLQLVLPSVTDTADRVPHAEPWTAVYEYRADLHQEGGRPCEGAAWVPGALQVTEGRWICPDRQVSAQHDTYLAWVAAGFAPQQLPAQQVAPRPTLTAAQLAAQISEATQAERTALLDCQAEQVAAAALGGPAPDCALVAEAWQVARQNAEATLRAQYEVVP